MENKILPCLVCDKVCEPAMGVTGGVPTYMNHPHAGTVFTTRGHYGSTVFDSMDQSNFLEITICDECMIKHKEKIIEGRRRLGSSGPLYTQWEGP